MVDVGFKGIYSSSFHISNRKKPSFPPKNQFINNGMWIGGISDVRCIFHIRHLTSDMIKSIFKFSNYLIFKFCIVLTIAPSALN